MQYIQVSIEVPEEQQQEILIGVLSALNATGLEQTATHLLAYSTKMIFPVMM